MLFLLPKEGLIVRIHRDHVRHLVFALVSPSDAGESLKILASLQHLLLLLGKHLDVDLSSRGRLC